MTHDGRELNNERFCELVDTFGGEPQTRALLMAILEAKAAPADERAQLLAVSHHLAEVMQNHYTTSRLYNLITVELSELQGDYQEGNETEQELRSGLLIPVLSKAVADDIALGKAAAEETRVVSVRRSRGRKLEERKQNE